MVVSQTVAPVLKCAAHTLYCHAVSISRRMNEVEIFAASFPNNAWICAVAEKSSQTAIFVTKTTNCMQTRAAVLADICGNRAPQVIESGCAAGEMQRSEVG